MGSRVVIENSTRNCKDPMMQSKRRREFHFISHLQRVDYNSETHKACYNVSHAMIHVRSDEAELVVLPISVRPDIRRIANLI